MASCSVDLISTVRNFLILILLFAQITRGWKPRHFPKIGISEFAMQDEEDHHIWETDLDKMPDGAVSYLENGQTYLVSQPVMALTIDCNASYPIQWNFLHAEDAAENVYSVRIRMFRYAKDIYNPLTNSYTSQLQLYGDTNAISGQYVCFSTEYEDVQKQIYIYWKGSSSPSPLIPQERTEEICVKSDNTAVLPCRVADPDSRPKLYFEVKCNEKYKTIDSPYIKFDPKIGYTIDLSQYNGAFGRYKCAMNEEDSFPAYFNLRNETCAPRVFNNTMIGSARFYYNKKEERVVCCSNSQKAPTIQGIFCFDPVSCKMREFRLFKNGINGVVFKNGSCVHEKIYERDAGLLRCKGDGIDVMRPIYTELQTLRNESFNVYFDWGELQPQRLMALSVGGRKPLYDKQNISVNCETSYFYFAEGVKWAIRWKNGSLEFLNMDDDLSDQDKAGTLYQTMKLPLHTNMSEILCFAPVWNSSEWINKTYPVDIRESVAPKFDKDAGTIEIVNLKLNDTDQTLVCQAAVGRPLPILRWRKNNRTVLNENNMSLKRRNGTMVLTILRVSHETQGEYRCIASNLAGRAEKVVRVYVIDPGQPLSFSSILFVIFLLLLLGGVMGFLLWRMQLQRKIISHLTGIVFRDMSDQNGAASSNSNGGTNSDTNNSNPSVLVNNNNRNRAAHHVTASLPNGGMGFSTAQVIPEPSRF